MKHVEAYLFVNNDDPTQRTVSLAFDRSCYDTRNTVYALVAATTGTTAPVEAYLVIRADAPGHTRVTLDLNTNDADTVIHVPLVRGPDVTPRGDRS